MSIFFISPADAFQTSILLCKILFSISKLQAMSTNHQALQQTEEAELESRRFANQASASWSELYLNQEHELRLDADQLANNLQSYTHHTQNILTGLNRAAETHEQVRKPEFKSN